LEIAELFKPQVPVGVLEFVPIGLPIKADSVKLVLAFLAETAIFAKDPLGSDPTSQLRVLIILGGTVAISML
jgi:hypothetical protein